MSGSDKPTRRDFLKQSAMSVAASVTSGLPLDTLGKAASALQNLPVLSNAAATALSNFPFFYIYDFGGGVINTILYGIGLTGIGTTKKEMNEKERVEYLLGNTQTLIDRLKQYQEASVTMGTLPEPDRNNIHGFFAKVREHYIDFIRQSQGILKPKGTEAITPSADEGLIRIRQTLGDVLRDPSRYSLQHIIWVVTQGGYLSQMVPDNYTAAIKAAEGTLERDVKSLQSGILSGLPEEVKKKAGEFLDYAIYNGIHTPENWNANIVSMYRFIGYEDIGLSGQVKNTDIVKEIQSLFRQNFPDIDFDAAQKDMEEEEMLQEEIPQTAHQEQPLYPSIFTNTKETLAQAMAKATRGRKLGD